MDLFALLASVSVLVAVLVLAFALFSGAASNVLIRGRLDVVLNESAGVGDAPAVAALRETRKLSGPLRSRFPLWFVCREPTWRRADGFSGNQVSNSLSPRA